MEEKVLTGKASIDKPWMVYYPQMLLDMIKVPNMTLVDYVKSRCPGMDVTAMSMYGTETKWSTLFEEMDMLAASLKKAGVQIDDQIPVFFRTVPEFFPILFACEKIGASMLCRDNTLEENVEAVAKAGSKIMFAHTFLTQDELKAYQEGTQIEKVIVLEPCRSCKREDLPDFAEKGLQAFYTEGAEYANGDMVMTYDEFLAYGKDYDGEIDAPEDQMRPLYRVYTSGSTGPSKQVLHSAKTMLDSLVQMNFYGGSRDGSRPTWLITCLPPALIAVVINMTLIPMTSGQLLYLDPFVGERDVDKSFALHKPNSWPLIPLFAERLMRGGAVGPDFDMSFFTTGGIGAEAFNNGQIDRIAKFYKDHGSPCRFTVGYGQSEAGTSMTLPLKPTDFHNNDVGVPMPLANVSIFKPGTTEELPYGTIGEICKTGAGNMLGYDNPEATAKALMLHEDGQIWLHSGDLGSMDPDGTLRVLTRGESPRWGGGDLMILTMENRVADAKIEGIDDEFFVNIPDPEHEGYFEPHLYVVLEDGYTVDDIREKVNAAMEPYQRPVNIVQIPERPFFHFKTNRIGITREVLAARANAK